MNRIGHHSSSFRRNHTGLLISYSESIVNEKVDPAIYWEMHRLFSATLVGPSWPS